MDDFRAGRHVIHNLNAHLVLTTKYRRGAMTTDRVRDLLFDVIRQVASDMGATVAAIEAEPDHLHVMVEYPPKLALSSLVNSLKGVSSRRLREKQWPEVKRVLWGDAFWSPSYCVVSCGGAPLDIIRRYIENQNNPERDRRAATARARVREAKKDGKKKTP